MHARARLDTWREQGADRFDPIRFHVMDALERRATHHDGEVRRLLNERLSTLLDAYEVDLKRGWRRDQGITGASDNAAKTRGLLGALVDQAATVDGVSSSASLAVPEVLEEFRKLWSTLRTNSQVRQSLQQIPTNAGPLNSSALVHRAVTLMRELSPGYLQHFLGYIDELTWLEQMNMPAHRVEQDAPLTMSTRKRAPRKARKQQE
jgi:hypothetical protein